MILCAFEWLPTQYFLPCIQWFHNELKFFLYYLLLLEWKFGWALSPFPCSVLFAVHLEWSLNTSFDKISNAVCIFVYCVPLSSVVQIFFSLFLFSDKMHKRRKKEPKWEKLNVDRQFFKDVVRIFWYSGNFIAGLESKNS